MLYHGTNEAGGSSERAIAAGDLVIVYENMFSMKAVYTNPASRFDNKFGSFPQKEWIGKPFGSKVYSKVGGKGWVYLLAPTPELWSLVLRHRTQILYLADISMVITQLELQPGSVVLESGTGSGSLTTSLARAVAPYGHVHTYEFHPQRAEEAAKEFKQNGLADCITVQQRNIEEQGFPDTLHGRADAVFLDLPGPWKVVESASKCLRPDGRFCSFSPCIEQVQRTCEALEQHGFSDIQTLEVLLRYHEVKAEPLCIVSDEPAVGLPDSLVRASKKPRANGMTDVGGNVTQAASNDVQGSSMVSDVELGTSAAEQVAAPAAAAAAVLEEEAVPPEGTEAGHNIPLNGNNAMETADDGGQQPMEVTTAGSIRPGVSSHGEGVDQDGKKGSKRSHHYVAEIKQAKMPASAFATCITTKPSMDAKGHTGYLTFARLFVVA